LSSADVQSFQFLLDVSEFKEDLLLDNASNGKDKKSFKGFGSYFAIVNDYIKDGSNSEVNIAFKTKDDIRKFAKFKDYASLDLVREVVVGRQRERESGEKEGLEQTLPHQDGGRTHHVLHFPGKVQNRVPQKGVNARSVLVGVQ